MNLYVEDLGIFAELRLSVDLDEQGLYNIKPDFFDENEGTFIATAAQVDEWLKNGGAERLRQYFYSDVVSSAQEVGPSYITIWYNGQEI